MAVKDIRSNLKEIIAFNQIINSDTDSSVSIDTADLELGLMFSMSCAQFGTGDFALTLEESVTGAFGGEENTISGDQLIGTLPVITAGTGEGATLDTVGVISNLRFVRVTIIATNTPTNSTIVVTATQKAENMPVE